MVLNQLSLTARSLLCQTTVLYRTFVSSRTSSRAADAGALSQVGLWLFYVIPMTRGRQRTLEADERQCEVGVYAKLGSDEQ